MAEKNDLPQKLQMTIPGAEVHLYGKCDGAPGRKMGHVKITSSSWKSSKSFLTLRRRECSVRKLHQQRHSLASLGHISFLSKQQMCPRFTMPW
jgi:phosphoribosylaminoimidazole carboxylase (NCAIR synthetase)